MTFLKIFQKSSWAYFCHTILLGLGFLLARGVPYGESIKIVALISFQVLIGGHIWSRLNRSRAVGSFEFFGMGFAFGTISFTVVDQMLVNLGFRVNYWVLGVFTVFVALGIKKWLPVDRVLLDEAIDIIQLPNYLMLFVIAPFIFFFQTAIPLWCLVFASSIYRYR